MLNLFNKVFFPFFLFMVFQSILFRIYTSGVLLIEFLLKTIAAILRGSSDFGRIDKESGTQNLTLQIISN